MMMSHLQEGIQHADVPTQVHVSSVRYPVVCVLLLEIFPTPSLIPKLSPLLARSYYMVFEFTPNDSYASSQAI